MFSQPEFQHRIGGGEFLDSSILEGNYLPQHRQSISDRIKDAMPYAKDVARDAGKAVFVLALMAIGYKLLVPREDRQRLEPYMKPDGEMFEQELQ